MWVLPLTRVFVIFPLLKYKLQGGQQVKYGQGGTDKIFCPIGSLPQLWSLPNPLNEEEEEEDALARCPNKIHHAVLTPYITMLNDNISLDIF